MSKVNDDCMAFPISESHPQYGTRLHKGMNLRDWFAGQALAGVWAGRESDFVNISSPTTTDVAALGYAIADAMMKARNATNDT